MPKLNLEEIKNSWKGFVEEGIIPEKIDPLILESWERCQEMGLDPYGGSGTVVSKEELKKINEDNRELIEISKPIMENLNSMVSETGFVLVLTNKEGVILRIIGEKRVKEDSRQLFFQPGVLWTEEAVGTNAIGCCLAYNNPVQTIGAEHYCELHHRWTCSAAPIHDRKGEIIGVINMSGYSENAHKHTLGIVISAAYSIERQLHLFQSHAIIEATLNNFSDGVLVVDRDNRINMVNKASERILGMSKEKIIGLDIGKMLEIEKFKGARTSSTSFVTDLNFNGISLTCSVRINPIDLGDNQVGSIFTFKEISNIQDTVKTVTGNTALYEFDNIISQNKKMAGAIRQAEKFAKTRGPVLIEGESGTGKELFAHSIHNSSSYREGPFVAINCASLPKDLVESELFGYEGGSFTGASREGKIGKFELANGGTIFLDEIGELPLDLQAKLLRVLDNYTITRIGGKSPKRLNLRVIVATNRDLLSEVAKKNFREDLYYRLNVFKITVPPLRERDSDVSLLFNYFLNDLNRYNNSYKMISESFLKGFNGYEWKGNVRELQNIIERAYYLSEGDLIDCELIPEEIRNRGKEEDQIKSFCVVENERNLIELALEKSGGHVVEASKLLGFSKSKLYRKIKEYEINSKDN